MSDTSTQENTIADASSVGNAAVLMGSAHVTSFTESFDYVQKITPHGLNARQNNDGFGSILSQGDGFIVVGVPTYSYSLDGSTVCEKAGCAWVFREQTDGSWKQEAKLGLKENNTGAQFGFSVLTVGQDIYIGAPYYDYDASGGNESDDAGAVFHYTYDSTNGWTLAQTIVASGVNGRNANDWFGWSFSASSTDLFVGAPGHQYDASGTSALDQAGAVFHFTKAKDGTWTQSDKIVGMGPNPRSASDNFGSNVLFDGTRLLIQAKGFKFDSQGINSIQGAGAIFVINYSTGSAVYEGRLISQNREANLNFGSKLDININKIVVSGATGRAQEEFSYDGTTWSNIASKSFTDTIPDYVANIATTSGNRIASNLSPYKDLSASSCYFNNSDSSMVNTITASRKRASISFWTMFDNTKIINGGPVQSQYRTNSVILSYASNLCLYNDVQLDAQTASLNNHAMEIGFSSTVISGNRCPVVEGNWYHILITYNEGICNLYVNGVWYQQAYANNLANYNSFTFSDFSYCNTQYFSDVRYYREQVVANGPFLPPTTAYSSGSGTSQANVALYINDDVAFSDTTVTKMNLVNSTSYFLDQPASGAFIIDNTAIMPKGRTASITAGSFGNKVKIKDNIVVVQAPADNTDAIGNNPFSMTGALYSYDLSTESSSVEKRVSKYRGLNSLYFADDFDIEDNGDVTAYSPRQTWQISAVYNYRQDLYSGAGWLYYNTMAVNQIAGITEEFGSSYSSRPMIASKGFPSSSSSLYSGIRSYNARISPSYTTTKLINKDPVTGVVFNYSLGNTAYPNYAPTQAAGSLSSYATTAIPAFYFTAPGTSNVRNSSAYFGSAVGISGDCIIVGAKNNEYTLYGSANGTWGGAYIFQIDPRTSLYRQIQKIDNNHSISYYGANIVSTDTKVIIGGLQNSSEGSVLFDNNSGSFVEDTFFRPSSTTGATSVWSASNVGLGIANAILSDTEVVFGMPYSDGANTDIGSVVYASKNGTTWTTENLALTGFVNARFANDLFGSTVYLDSNIAAIGAPGHDYQLSGTSVPSGTSGAVFTYSYNATTNKWSQQNIITAPSGSGITSFGSVLALKSNTMIVSNNLNTTYNFVVMTTTDTVTWTSTTLTSGNNSSNYGNYIGSAALMNGSHAVIGVPYLSWPSNSNVGGFYSPTLSNGTWAMPNYSSNWTEDQGYANGVYRIPLHTNGRLEKNEIDYTLLMTHGRLANDNFGTSVSINPSGTLIAIGVPNRHVNKTGQQTSVYGGIEIQYFDADKKKFRLQSRFSEADNSSPTTTGVGKSIAFYDDTHLVTGGTSYSNTGLLRFVTLSGTSMTDGISNYLQNNYTGFTSGTSLGSSVAISGNNLYFGMPSYPDYGSWGVATTTNGVTWDASSTTTSTAHTIRGIVNVRNSNDKFGFSVEVVGNRFWVGCPYSYTDLTGTIISANTGSVYVYDYDTNANAKVFVEKLLPKTYGSAYFGYSISANTESVGISGGTSGATNPYAAIYDYTAGKVSTKVAEFSKPTSPASALWGVSIGIQNDKNVVLGMPDINTIDSIVLDDTYQISSRTSKQASYISDYNNREFNFNTVSTSNMLFGTSIASGDGFIAVGVPNWTQTYNGTSYTSGAVAIFNKTSTGYDLEAILLDDFTGSSSSNLSLGSSISAGGNTVVIGTPLRTSNAGGYLIYQRSSDGLWDLVKSERFISTSSYVGSSVATNNGIAVIGATLLDGLTNQTPVTNSGCSFVLRNNKGIWTGLDEKMGDSGTYYPSDASSSINGDPSKYYTHCGGGGSGLRGGTTYEISYVANIGGAGGSNLVPENGQSVVGTLYTPPMAGDKDIGSSAVGGILSATTTGGNGGNARVVIYDTESKIYDFTGSDQTYVVPEGVTSITVKLWGAGGGSGSNYSTTQYPNVGCGGAGGFVSGTLSVTPGEKLTVIVGQGGIGGTTYVNNSAIPSAAYGGGGLGGANGLSLFGGSGGGRAEIMRGDISLAIAGGGGGGSAIVNLYDSVSSFTNGAPGGSDGSGNCQQGQMFAVMGNVNTRAGSDFFGTSVTQISDTEIAVGVPFHSFDNNGQAIPSHSGAIMIYSYNGSRWVYDYRLNSSTLAANQYFGSYIDSSNDTLAGVGGSFSKGYTGLVYSYTTSTSYMETFAKNSKWVSNGIHAADTKLFTTVAIVNDTKVVAGIPDLSSTPTTPTVSNAGGFLTLDLADTTWTITTQSVAPGISFGRQANDQFGTQVYMGAGWVAASAPKHGYSYDAMTNINGRGAAFIFHKDITTGAFVYEDKLFNTSTNSYFNGSGTFMTYSKGALTLAATSTGGTYLSTWTRTNNVFGNMTTGVTSSDIATISSFCSMDQNRVLTGCSTGNDYNTITTGFWNFYPSNSTAYPTAYANRIVVPGLQNGRKSNDYFGTGVALMETAGVIAVTAPGQDFTETGSSLSKAGAIYTYYIPTGSTTKKYVYETKLYNTGSQTITMDQLDSKGTSILAYGPSSGTVGLYSRTRIGSWVLMNSVKNSYMMSAALSTPTMFGIGQSTSYSDATHASMPNSGSAVFYQNNSSIWTALPTVFVDGLTNTRQASDNFGTSMVMNSNYAMISAPGHVYTNGGIHLAGSGSIFIYGRVGDKLDIVNMVTNPSNTAAASFGQILSLADDNSYYAVGSPLENSVYVFRFDGINSTLVATLTPPEDVGTVSSTTMFGASVAIQNQDLLVGIPGMSDGTAATGGVARYENQNGTWTFIGLMSEFINATSYDNQHPAEFVGTEVATAKGDALGTAVAVNKERGAFFGAPGNTTDQTGENPVTGAGAAWFKYLG